MSLEQTIRNRREHLKSHISKAFGVIPKSKPTPIVKQDPLNKADAIEIMKQIDIDLSKGKAGTEGEIREWGGKKYKKIGKEWKEVGKGKDGDKKEDGGDNKQSKDDKGGDKGGSQEGTSKVDIAQLTFIKRNIEEHPDRSYDIYQTLSPEAQAAVPQELVDKMVHGSHDNNQEDNAASGVFNDKKEEPKPEKKESVEESVYTKPLETADEMVDAISKLSDADKKDLMYEFGEMYKNGGQDMTKQGAEKLASLGILSQKYARGHGYVFRKTREGGKAITIYKKESAKKEAKPDKKADEKDKAFESFKQFQEGYFESDNPHAFIEEVTGSPDGVKDFYATYHPIYNTEVDGGESDDYAHEKAEEGALQQIFKTLDKAGESLNKEKESGGDIKSLQTEQKKLEKTVDRLAGGTASSSATKKKLKEAVDKLGAVKKQIADHGKKDIKKALDILIGDTQ
jgi:hypothetical protein